MQCYVGNVCLSLSPLPPENPRHIFMTCLAERLRLTRAYEVKVIRVTSPWGETAQHLFSSFTPSVSWGDLPASPYTHFLSGKHSVSYCSWRVRSPTVNKIPEVGSIKALTIQRWWLLTLRLSLHRGLIALEMKERITSLLLGPQRAVIGPVDSV